MEGSKLKDYSPGVEIWVFDVQQNPIKCLTKTTGSENLSGNIDDD